MGFGIWDMGWDLGFGIWDGIWDLGYGMGFGIWDGIWDMEWDLGFGIWDGLWDLGLGYGCMGLGYDTNGIWDFPKSHSIGGKYTYVSFSQQTLSLKNNNFSFTHV